METKDYVSIGSVLFAIYRYFYPKNVAKYDLSFLKENEIEVNSHDFKFFSEIQFFFKKAAVKNIKSIHFSIRNTGKVDITSEMLKEYIKIKFPIEYKILDSKLSNEENLPESKLIYEGNTLSISWDLLKPK